jgi:ubiquinone/menaquinone biosynthesis C-methylase UbiE
MMVKLPLRIDVLLSRMSSLADATRLRILRLLERRELGVVDMCDVLQLPQSTVSRHLKILSDQGWLRSSRRGTTHLYRMPLDQLNPAARRLWLLARDQFDDWATLRQDQLRLARRLRERQDRTQAFFAGAARRWERLRTEQYGGEFVRSAMLALLPPRYVVADLGCGTGQLTAELASVVRRVIAVDNSPAMLRAARRRTADLKNVELRRGDLASLPVADRSCDAALLLLALTYVDDTGSALSEAHRILKAGGKLIVVDLLPHDREDFQRRMGQHCRGFVLDQIKEWLHQAGLQEIDARPLPPAPEAKGPALFLATGIVRGPERKKTKAISQSQ